MNHINMEEVNGTFGISFHFTSFFFTALENSFKGGSHTVTNLLLAFSNLGDEIPFKGGSL